MVPLLITRIYTLIHIPEGAVRRWTCASFLCFFFFFFHARTLKGGARFSDFGGKTRAVGAISCRRHFLYVVCACRQLKCVPCGVFAVRSVRVLSVRTNNMYSVTSVDLRGVPRGRCKNTECDCPEFSRDTAPPNSAIPNGWCCYCGHSPVMHGRLEYLGKQILS